MKTYIGCKVIRAEPQMNPKKTDVDEAGYKVVYPDGYTSWSPKEAFEAAYREMDPKTFSLITGVK